MHEFANWFESLPQWAGLTITILLFSVPLLVVLAAGYVLSALVAKYLWTKPVTISIEPPTKAQWMRLFAIAMILSIFGLSIYLDSGRKHPEYKSANELTAGDVR